MYNNTWQFEVFFFPFPSVSSHGLTPTLYQAGLTGKSSRKCVEQMTQTFSFPHTAPRENKALVC